MAFVDIHVDLCYPSSGATSTSTSTSTTNKQQTANKQQTNNNKNNRPTTAGRFDVPVELSSLSVLYPVGEARCQPEHCTQGYLVNTHPSRAPVLSLERRITETAHMVAVQYLETGLAWERRLRSPCKTSWLAWERWLWTASSQQGEGALAQG